MPAPDAVVVRELRDEDAESLLSLHHALDAETSMMMLEPGERTVTVGDVRAQLRRTVKTANATILAAQAGDELVGYVEAAGGRYRRTRHTAYVVIGVRDAWQGRGLGRELLMSLEKWARGHGIRRLELTVRVDNARARRLYERARYITEGVRRASLVIGNETVDELAMARIIEPDTESA